MSITVGIWVLTKSYNDYDQHGEYYVKAWLRKPCMEDLITVGVSRNDIKHVLAGGGRRDFEDVWYELLEQE